MLTLLAGMVYVLGWFVTFIIVILKRIFEPSSLKKGEEEMEKGIIEIETFHGRTESIEKADVDYVMLYTPDVSSKEEFIWLKLGSFHGPSLILPTENKEKLQQIEPYLFGLKGFDKERYRTVLETKKVLPSNEILWMRKVIPNYKLPEKPKKQVDLNDLEKGLYIENLEQRVLWGSYKDLKKLDFVKTSKEQFPNPNFYAKRYSLKQPVIFGGLELGEIYTDTDSTQRKLKLHLPVIKYMTILQLPNPEINLQDLAAHFNAYFQQDFEKDTAFKTLEYTWKKGRIRVKLYCHYREELQQYNSCSYLTIEYEPDLRAFYASSYLKNDFKLQNCSFLKLGFKADLNTNYREVEYSAYTPESVKSYFFEERPLLFWVDKKFNRFCVANREYSLIFKTSKIKNLYLDVYMERGIEVQNGLQLQLKNGKKYYLGRVESIGTYDENYPKIREWLPFFD